MRRVAAKFFQRLLKGAQKKAVSQLVSRFLIVPNATLLSRLVPEDFFLFPKLKSSLKGRQFQAVDEI
jgi:hypothetical protein